MVYDMIRWRGKKEKDAILRQVAHVRSGASDPGHAGGWLHTTACSSNGAGAAAHRGRASHHPGWHGRRYRIHAFGGSGRDCHYHGNGTGDRDGVSIRDGVSDGATHGSAGRDAHGCTVRYSNIFANAARAHGDTHSNTPSIAAARPDAHQPYACANAIAAPFSAGRSGAGRSVASLPRLRPGPGLHRGPGRGRRRQCTSRGATGVLQ